MTSVAAAPAPVLPQPPGPTSGRRTKFVPWWYVLFFFSGFPALLYQIVWQRALFTFYGVNIESVTMVVTAFMAGLGLGSLAGGAISKRNHLPMLALFGLVELFIAAYGAVSLRIFHWAAAYTAGVGALQTGLIAFTLVLAPTMLMGSTLPMLVSYTVRRSHNVGSSVGALYAVNTLGSATACFCAGSFIMRRLGESGSVALAAAINAGVGLCVLALHLRSRMKTSNSAANPSEAAAKKLSSLGRDAYLSQADTPRDEPTEKLNFVFALLIVGVAGFISLAYEIVWYRLFSFYTAGAAKSFAFLLGAYLTGIGIGSLVCQRMCKPTTERREFVQTIVTCIFAANFLGFLVAPVLSRVVYYADYQWTWILVGVTAAFLGAVFPLTCHISVPPEKHAGARMSYLYLSSIIGSALGSYLVGFVVMDVLPIKQIAVLLALLGGGLGTGVVLKLQLPRRDRVAGMTAAVVLALFVGLTPNRLFDALYEKMLFKENYPQDFHFAEVVENKSGVITVTPEGVVFGGGIYDGRFNVDLVNDPNQIQRAYALSYFHPNPRQVLMIGLSSGSWAQVIANHSQVEHLTIVEINPGYLQLIAKFPSVASLLKNPKVRIEIDDGRRWLVRNADKKFDAIVMNSSFHWRSHATNLLSTDFLQLVQRHLKPGGVHFFNTTGSNEVQATALHVFPYGMRLANFMVVSESPLQLDAARWQQTLTHYTIDGKPVFNLALEKHRARLQKVLSMADTMDQDIPSFFTLESAEHVRTRTQQARISTDDNMGTEWLQ